MVTRQIYIIIETVLLRVTLGISVSILIFIIITFGLAFFRNLKKKLQVRTRRRILSTLLEYLLGEVPLDRVSYRRRQRGTTVDAFATVVATIKGSKKERMKQAVTALGLLRDIERGLRRASPSKRMRACYSMGILGTEEAVTHLMRRLTDSNPKVVSSAIIALGELRNRNAAVALLDLYYRCTLSQAWLIAAILPFFGNETYVHIKPLLDDESLPPARLILLIKVVSGFRLSESLEVLQRLYRENSSLDVRINSLLAIGKINDLFAVKSVIDALSDPEWQIRAVACNLIGDMAIKGAIDRLISLLTDESWFVRKNSAAALVKLGRIGIMGLFTALNSDDRYARDMVVQTLQEHGILERIIGHLGGGNEVNLRVAYRIVKFLAKRGYRKFLDNYRGIYPLIEKIL